jgi:hypothetical protein
VELGKSFNCHCHGRERKGKRISLERRKGSMTSNQNIGDKYIEEGER